MLQPLLILEHNPFIGKQFPWILEHNDLYQSRQQGNMLRNLGAQALRRLILLLNQAVMLLKLRFQCFGQSILSLKRVVLEHNQWIETQNPVI